MTRKYNRKEYILENLEQLEYDIYATQSAYDILNWMKNRSKPYRIVYDKNIKYYFIGPALEYIHLDLLEAAYRSGFYPDMLSQNEMMNYLEDEIASMNDTILLFAFYPTDNHKQDVDKSSDGYTRKYKYDFGCIYSHEMTPLEDFDLYKILGEPIKKDYVYENQVELNDNIYEELNKILERYL